MRQVSFVPGQITPVREVRVVWQSVVPEKNCFGAFFWQVFKRLVTLYDFLLNNVCSLYCTSPVARRSPPFPNLGGCDPCVGILHMSCQILLQPTLLLSNMLFLSSEDNMKAFDTGLYSPLDYWSIYIIFTSVGIGGLDLCCPRLCLFPVWIVQGAACRSKFRHPDNRTV